MSRLEDLGEDGFLQKLPSWLKTKNPAVNVGIGDDALVLSDGTVVTSDSYEEGIHFSLRYFSPEDVGFKSAAATLSDIAAMGAEPICLVVNLFCSRDSDVEFIKGLYRGMEEVSEPLGSEIAGGDTVASQKLILSLTAIGKASSPLLRSGAKPGNLLYLSGFPGLSAVGEEALRKGLKGFKESKARHLRPKPRIALGLALAHKASACIDTSDGLSTDANHLARSSRIKLIIEQNRLPRHPEVIRWAEESGLSPDSFVLNAGEDYELLFTSSDNISQELVGIPIHRIGRIEEGKGVFLETDKGLKPLIPGGWDHFAK